jgi:hypothetical protein
MLHALVLANCTPDVMPFMRHGAQVLPYPATA